MRIIMKIKSLMAANIRKYRKKLHLTQAQASERAGMTVNYWQRIELASQTDLPSFPTFFRIAKALNIKPYQLLKE